MKDTCMTMKTNIKTQLIMLLVTLVTVLVFLASCSNSLHQATKKTNIVIASYDGATVQLTQHGLDQWLLFRKQLLLKSKREQIQSYFIEDSLFQNKGVLKQGELQKLKFLNVRTMQDSSIKLFKKRVMQSVEVDEDEIKENVEMLLQRNKLKGDKVRLYQIYKKYPINATQIEKHAIVKQMEMIRAQITNLESFKSTADTESDSQTRFQHGLIGNVPEGKFSGAINTLIMTMQAGELSQLIKGKKGILLFYCKKRIPPRKRNRKQIRNYVKNTLKNRNFNIAYKHKIKQVLEASKVHINWQALHEPKQKAVVVTTVKLTTKLTKQQVLWLLNGVKGSKSQQEFSHKKIEKTINQYIISQALYANLSQAQQQSLQSKAQLQYKQLVTTKVLAQLITNKINKPTDEETKHYYYHNQDSFMLAKKYDISTIAFKLDKKDKSSLYKEAQMVLNKVNNGSIGFAQAAKQYSFLKEKYNSGHLGSFSRNQLPSVLGINALKQILLMQVGDISPLVETDSGILWILKLNAIEEPRLMSFDAAKQQAHNQLGTIRARGLESNIIDEISTKMKITFY